MYSIWISDIEKAIKVFKNKVGIDLVDRISGNAYGDLVFSKDTTTWIIKHNDFSVWRNFGDWRHEDWRRL